MGGVSSLQNDARVNEISVSILIRSARFTPQTSRQLKALFDRIKDPENGTVAASDIKNVALDALNDEVAFLRMENARLNGGTDHDTKMTASEETDGIWAVNPNSTVYKTWWAFSAVLAMAAVVLAPLRLAFYSQDDGMCVHWITYGVDAFFWADAVLETFVLFEDELVSVEHKEEVERRKESSLVESDGTLAAAAQSPLNTGGPSSGGGGVGADFSRSLFVESDETKYKIMSWSGRLRRDWFSHLLDLLGVVPWELFGPRHASVFGGANLLGLMRILRFRRFWEFLQWISIVVWLPHYVSVIANYVTFVSLAAHFEGCTYFMLARGRGFSKRTWVGALTCNARGVCLDDLSRLDQVLSSIYWSMTTISTVGYGDLVPQSSSEMLFVILAMMINLALTCYMVASVSVMFKREEEVAGFRKDVTTLAQYLRHNKVPPKDVAHMVEYKRITFGLTRGHDVMSGFPAAIRTQVSEVRFEKMLHRTHLFNKVSRHFRQRVLAAASESLFLDGMVIANAGDAVVEAYILHSGIVNIVIDVDPNDPGRHGGGAESGAPPPAAATTTKTTSNHTDITTTTTTGGGGPAYLSSLQQSADFHVNYDRAIRYAREGKRVVATLSAGAVLCGEAFFASATQPWTLVAASTVSVLVLPANESMLLQQEPANLKIVLQNLRKDVESYARRARGLEGVGDRRCAYNHSPGATNAGSNVVNKARAKASSMMRRSLGVESPEMAAARKLEAPSSTSTSSSAIKKDDGSKHSRHAKRSSVIGTISQVLRGSVKVASADPTPDAINAINAANADANNNSNNDAAAAAAAAAEEIKEAGTSGGKRKPPESGSSSSSSSSAVSTFAPLRVARKSTESLSNSLFRVAVSTRSATKYEGPATLFPAASGGDPPAGAAAAGGGGGQNNPLRRTSAKMDPWSVGGAGAKGTLGKQNSAPNLTAMLLAKKAFRLKHTTVSTTLFASVRRDASFAALCDQTSALLTSCEAQNEAQLVSSMCDYASRGDVTELRLLLEQLSRTEANTEELRKISDYDLRTPAHVAAAMGQLEVLKLLSDFAFRLDGEDAFGGTPILDAVVKAPRLPSDSLTHLQEPSRPDIDVIDFLRSKTGKLTKKNLGELMCHFCSSADVMTVSRLCRAGADPDACDYDQRVGLHIAAAEGHIETVRILVQRGATLDFRDRWGQTACMEAVAGGHVHTLCFLLERGASVTTRDLSGTSVLFSAIRAGRDDCAEILLQHDADLAVDDPGGVLCAAASEGDLRMVERLLRAGLDPNSCDYDKRTPLHLAAAEGRWPVVTTLVEHGASITFKDRWGHDALSEAKYGSHREIADYLTLRAREGAAPPAATNHGSRSLISRGSNCGSDDRHSYDRPSPKVLSRGNSFNLLERLVEDDS